METTSTRKVFIGGNWKSNGDLEFVNKHVAFLNQIDFDQNKCQVAVSPISIHLGLVKSALNSKFIVSSQNVSQFDNGAYTGEISAKQLIDSNINWTLIGHSERRKYFGDDEEAIAKKIKISIENKLNVIACIGEELVDREANQTMNVINSQLKTICDSVKDWNMVVIAYEPVWAIGTGRTASPGEAQEVHMGIRNYIKTNVSEEVANSVRIIYGGSVSKTNAGDLIKEKDIDGFLVGGASLKEDFKAIVAAGVQN